MNTAIEDRIRSRAYELWEAEGRPEGREVDHWLRAAQEISGEVAGETAAEVAAESSVVGTPVARRPRTPRSASTAASPATRAPAAATARSRSRASKGTTTPLP
jgi:hypothetical protein